MSRAGSCGAAVRIIQGEVAGIHVESEHEAGSSSSDASPIKLPVIKKGKYNVKELGDVVVALATSQANKSKNDKEKRARIRSEKAHNPVFVASASIIAEIGRLGGTFNSVTGTLKTARKRKTVRPAGAFNSVTLKTARKRKRP